MAVICGLALTLYGGWAMFSGHLGVTVRARLLEAYGPEAVPSADVVGRAFQPIILEWAAVLGVLRLLAIAVRPRSP